MRHNSLFYRSVLTLLVFPISVIAVQLNVQSNGSDTQLGLTGQEPFHTTEAMVSDARLIEVPDSTILLVLWNEQNSDGRITPHYTFSFDGEQFSHGRRTSYDIKLRHGTFDALVNVNDVDALLTSDSNAQLYIVQFVTQPLDTFRTAITNLGGTVYSYLPNNAHIVKMDENTRNQVEALPYVRWVGKYHPAYRMENYLRNNLDRAAELFPQHKYPEHYRGSGYLLRSDGQGEVACRLQKLSRKHW